MSNSLYRNKGVADIRKIPMPVQITTNNKGNKTGYTTNSKWVDDVGIHNGHTIVFDAKEVSVDRFDLKNLEQHQFNLLKRWHNKGAKSFLLEHKKNAL